MGRKAGRNPHTIYRHNLIRKAFKRLGEDLTTRGKQRHTYEAKLEILHKKYGFSIFTIETIISKEDEPENQMKLF